MLHRNSTTGKEILIMINSKLDLPSNYPFCFILILQNVTYEFDTVTKQCEMVKGTLSTLKQPCSDDRRFICFNFIFFDPTENVFSILIQFFLQYADALGILPVIPSMFMNWR